jgi:hypothetical protein
VPHVNDARRRQECARLLGAPLYAELKARAGGRRPVDTDDCGQQEFQALLLWCLLSPRRSLSWDTKTGRSFRDMRCYYSWVSPRRDRLVMGWSTAARVASYLLPRAENEHPGFSGIPGLRLTSVTRDGIELVHLPTGGRLELHDDMRGNPEFRTALFGAEVSGSAGRAGGDGGEPLWLAPSLTAEEKSGLDEWTLAQHAPVMSAVMARIHIWWQHWDTGPEFGADPVTGIPRLSWWSGPPLDYVGFLLAEPSSAVHVAGSARRNQGAHIISLRIGEGVIELQGPAPHATGCPGITNSFHCRGY